MDILQYRDYRDYLRSELAARAGRNARYSMRAFARDLGLSPQMLSFVLNGKKGISSQTAARLVERLEMDPSQANFFLDLVSLAHATHPQARKLAQHRVDERLAIQGGFRPLDLDLFRAISDWHHAAILELTFAPGFKAEARWLGRRLGISAVEAGQAMQRLKDLELLVNEGGRWTKRDLHLSADYGKPTAALAKVARQLLLKGADALSSQGVEERDFTTMTMAIDPTRLPEAKEMIKIFRRKLCAHLEQGKRTEVYVFAPSLFRLTQKI